jgi:hypothetical protein
VRRAFDYLPSGLRPRRLLACLLACLLASGAALLASAVAMADGESPAQGGQSADDVSESPKNESKAATVKGAGAKKDGVKKPNASESSPARKAAAGKKKEKSLPEREAIAFDFVRGNHPELADVLTQLKQSHPHQYTKAIADLCRASERLEQFQDEPARHALELEAWRLKSRAELLAAKSSMSEDPAIGEELRATLAQQLTVQLEIMEAERQHMSERLEKLEGEIKQLREGRAAQLDQRMKTLQRQINKSRALAQQRESQPGDKSAAGKPGVEKPEVSSTEKILRKSR